MILNCLLYQLPPHQSRALIWFLSLRDGGNKLGSYQSKGTCCITS